MIFDASIIALTGYRVAEIMNIGSGFFTLYKITQRTVFFETGCIHVLEGSVTGSGRRIKDL